MNDLGFDLPHKIGFSMSHLEIVDRVRAEVRAIFQDLGFQDEVHETILIRNGHYCGRRFSNEKCQAVWFLEEDQIKVYAGDGRVVKSIGTSSEHQRHAA